MEKPKEIIQLEKDLRIQINIIEKETFIGDANNCYFLNKKNQVIKLNLSENKIGDISFLKNFQNLNELYLNNNEIIDISILKNLKNLTSLQLANNKISDISTLKELNKLIYLGLGRNEIIEISSLATLKNLEFLFLWYNRINDISPLINLNKVDILDLDRNEIKDISFLSKLTKLTNLNLASNMITDITPLQNLTNLKVLYLNKNKIVNILPLNGLLKLNTINLSDNPIKNTTISDFNDLDAIKGFLNSLNKTSLLVDNFDVKINILGAGRIGKSQLFNWMLNNPFEKKSNITHGTGVGIYKIKNKKHTASLWDFGGQSYQHGTHSLFLRPSDFYIVLYRSHEDYYGYGYWIGAARTFASDKIDNKFISPLLLVQSVWSSTQDVTIYPDSKKITNYQVDPDNIFAIDVKFQSYKSIFKLRNDYFKSLLDEKIIKHAKSFGKIPKVFVKEKKKIDSNPFKDIYIKKNIFKASLEENYSKEQFAYLLQYLEFTARIIYFREKKSLQNYIFTNPQILSDWIYKTVLDEEFLENSQGVLDYNKIVKDFGIEKAKIFKELMTQFNLLFNEPNVSKMRGVNNLVIPQFLPESNISFKKVLLELIPFTFSIKFEDFIYEGRIFNFLSEYGKFAEDKTSYWKYGILFRKNSIQVIVYYDMINRIINVHLENKKGFENIAQEILDYFILKQEDKDFLLSNKVIGGLSENNNAQVKISSNDSKRNVNFENIIIGAQLSTNRENYIDIIDTLKISKEQRMGFCVNVKKNFKLDLLTLKLLGMENKKLKKVFISYSRKDLKYKDALKLHLSILDRYDLIKAWSCEEVQSGKWNKQIQQELEESDIIIYMVSHNFLESNYIMTEEVKKGIELVENDSSKKIICVLTGVCQWQSWSQFEEMYNQSKDIKGNFSTMDLSQYQFLPYHQYKDDKGISIREEIVALEKWGRYPYDVENEAYNQIVNKIFSEIK